MRWKLRSPNVTRRAAWVDAVHTSESPSRSSPIVCPSTERDAARWLHTASLTSAVGSSTRARSNSMCGATGVSRMARWLGAMIGPRADSEYAVDPVGVPTMRLSAA